jgi:hypothetical protein
MIMNDSADRDERLIAATLASGLLANSSKETDLARPEHLSSRGGDLLRMSGCTPRRAGAARGMNALQQCRAEAQKCIEESTKAPHPALRAHWLALAEQWVNTAEYLFQLRNDRRS